VRLLVDAEHSYFQPAIDNTVTELQRTHNRTAPRIYNTVQARVAGGAVLGLAG
jgi:proline dehydrogenase